MNKTQLNQSRNKREGKFSRAFRVVLVQKEHPSEMDYLDKVLVNKRFGRLSGKGLWAYNSDCEWAKT